MINFSFLTKADNWLKQTSALVLLLSLHSILSIISSHYKDANGDEHGYLSYASRCLKGNMERTSKWDDSKTSIMVVALIPRIVSQLMEPELKKKDGGESDIINGRYVILLFSVILLIYLWLLLKKLNLPYSMLIFPLAIIDPMLLTYATLIISDLPVGLFSIAVLYHMREYYNQRKTKHLILASIAVGLGITCKFSFLPVLFGFILAVVIVCYKHLRKRQTLTHFIKVGTLVLLIALLTINCCYPFDQRFTTLKSNNNKSERFQSLSKKWLGALPLPLPRNMIQAADLLSFHSQPDIPENEGTFSGGAYLFNVFHKDEGPLWYYYFALLAFKTPLFLLVLFLTGLVSAFCSEERDTLVLVAACTFIFYFFYGGLFNTFQIGARHILAVYPFLFIVAGYAINKLSQWLSSLTLVISLLLGMIFTLISITYYFPHFLPYSNELIADKRIAHWIIGEGAVDYGQSEKYVGKLLKDNPDYHYALGQTDKEGKLIITMGTLFNAAWVKKDPKARQLWNRRPDEIKRFVVLIYHDGK